MATLSSKPLFELAQELVVPDEVTDSPLGAVRYVNIASGTFTGRRLKGKVVPGGSYSVRLRADSTAEIEARTTLMARGGHVIFMQYRGLLHAEPPIFMRLRAGDSSVKPTAYTYCVSATFETGSEKYAWLNRILAAGTGLRTANGVTYQLHELT
jgi:hypothetical protein